MVLWKIQNDKYEILIDIQNLSESCFSSITWSINGDYLFASNITGSISIVNFDEFHQVKIKQNQIVELENNNGKIKRKITPILLEGFVETFSKRDNKFSENSLPFHINNSVNKGSENSDKYKLNENSFVYDPYLGNDRQKINYSNKKNWSYDYQEKYLSLSTKFGEDFRQFAFNWKNNENNSTMQITYSSKILYSVKYMEAKILLFDFNNYFFALYTSRNRLVCKTLIGTTVILIYIVDFKYANRKYYETNCLFQFSYLLDQFKYFESD